MSHDNKHLVDRRRAPNIDRRKPHHPEKRAAPYSDRREEMKAERHQMDVFATAAFPLFLEHALAKSEDGKVDFNDVSRSCYLSAKSMMRQRRDFSRDYMEEGGS